MPINGKLNSKRQRLIGVLTVPGMVLPTVSELTKLLEGEITPKLLSPELRQKVEKPSYEDLTERPKLNGTLISGEKVSADYDLDIKYASLADIDMEIFLNKED